MHGLTREVDKVIFYTLTPFLLDHSNQLGNWGRRSIGRIDPVDPADHNGTWCNFHRIVWHVRKRRFNMADALATYWRRVSIRITTAVSNCVAKNAKWRNLLWIWCHFIEINFTHTIFLSIFKSIDITDWVQSAYVFFIFSWQKQIGSLYCVAGSECSISNGTRPRTLILIHLVCTRIFIGL